MLGSVHDADDPVQEALLRAWRGLAAFEGRSSLRSWLYRIATNVCLSIIERRPPRTLPLHDQPGAAPAEPAWVEPYPESALGAQAEHVDPVRGTRSGRASSWRSSRRSSTCRAMSGRRCCSAR
jgi:RNA polymerase sigma-70 factor, ECF subfamily